MPLDRFIIILGLCPDRHFSVLGRCKTRQLEYLELCYLQLERLDLPLLVGSLQRRPGSSLGGLALSLYH